MNNVEIVSDLFEETQDWVNDEEALSFQKIEDMVRDFIKNNGRKPTKMYVSNNEESQSYLLWFAKSYNLQSEPTEKVTYLE
tara:strand:+ start:98 stop:340 length:243 start_codon:yes stop_codon:yes gene_type:complete